MVMDSDVVEVVLVLPGFNERPSRGESLNIYLKNWLTKYVEQGSKKTNSHICHVA